MLTISDEVATGALAGILRSDDMRAVLQELPTDPPEIGVPRASVAVRAPLAGVGRDDEPRSPGPPLLALPHKDDLPIATNKHSIARHVAAFADEERWPDAEQLIELLEAGR